MGMIYSGYAKRFRSHFIKTESPMIKADDRFIPGVISSEHTTRLSLKDVSDRNDRIS